MRVVSARTLERALQAKSSKVERGGTVSDHDADARRERAAALKAAREARKGFVQTLGRIARTLMDAMTEFARMRQQGVSHDDACRGLEGVLRDVWPASQYQPACAICEDVGWEERVCQHRVRCGRKWCGLAEPAWEHRYVSPCACGAGDRHRERVYQPEDAIAAVGRTQRPRRGFSRIGG